MARPNLSYLKNLLLFVCGLPCGVLTGLTAIGSSVVVVPAVGYLLGLRGTRAAGTALAVTFFAALAGLLSYSEAGYVRGGLAVLLAVGQIVGAAYGQRLAVQVPALARLNLLWALLTVAGGLAMLWQGLPPQQGPAALAWPASLPALPFYLWALLVAVGVGVVSRVIALGGVLLVPAAIYLLRMPPHEAQGTALVVLLIASLPGLLIHARRGDAEPQSATWMSAGAVFGGLVGAFDATRIVTSDGTLLALFGVALTLLGLLMLWRRDPAAPAR